MYEIKKRVDIPTIITYIYKKDGSIITDRITYLTNTNALENKRSDNKDPYYLKHNKRPRDTL